MNIQVTGDKWCNLKLEHLAKFQNGYAFKSSDFNDNSGYIVVKMGNVTKDGKLYINDEKTKYITEEKAAKLSDFVLSKGDIVITMTDVSRERRLIGHTAIIDGDNKYILNQRVGRIVPKEDVLLRDYLHFFTNSPSFIEYIKKNSSGVLQFNTSTKAIRNALIPLPMKNNLPDINEQKRIADKIEKLFGDIDKAIAKTNKSIRLSQKLLASELKSIFLSDNKNNKKIKLGDNKYFDVETGSTPKTGNNKNWENGTIIWVTPKDLGEVNDIYISNSGRKITKAGYESCSTSLVPNGSVIISTRAPIGYISIAQIELCFNQGCKAIVIKNDNILSKYIYYAVLSVVGIMRDLGKGATFDEISKAKLEGIEIMVPFDKDQPDRTIQKRIIEKLDLSRETENKLFEKYQTKLNQLEIFKQSLLNQAFQGKL